MLPSGDRPADGAGRARPTTALLGLSVPTGATSAPPPTPPGSPTWWSRPPDGSRAPSVIPRPSARGRGPWASAAFRVLPGKVTVSDRESDWSAPTGGIGPAVRGWVLRCADPSCAHRMRPTPWRNRATPRVPAARARADGGTVRAGDHRAAALGRGRGQQRPLRVGRAGRLLHHAASSSGTPGPHWAARHGTGAIGPPTPTPTSSGGRSPPTRRAGPCT